MTNSFEKPYAIKFSATIEPSGLTKPYPIRIVYDKDATWNTLSISVVGLVSTTFGNVSAQYNQVVNPIGLDDSNFGKPFTENKQKFIKVGGSNHSIFGTGKIHNSTQIFRLQGYVASSMGNLSIYNFNKEIKVMGFVNSYYGKPTTYNLRQYVRNVGYHTAGFGTPFMQGGVKYVKPIGINSSVLTNPKVVNTKANQYIGLSGIPSLAVPSPNVSPRIIYPRGILPGGFGTAWVQRNPSPKGFANDSYGNPWVSHSPRYITPFKVESFLSGYGKVFDPKQRIYHEGSPPIPAGVFGDTLIKNTRRIINVPGNNQSLYGDWSEVRSNLITIGIQSFDANIFGKTEIWNKTPSIIPKSWNSNFFGSAFISYRIRRINARGIDWPESKRFGNHVLTKPPEIKPYGFNSMLFGYPWVSNFKRELIPPGMNTLRFSDPIVWYRYRYVSTPGIGIPGSGQPKIEHGLRTLLASGDAHMRFGTPVIWFKVRSLKPSSIYREFESKHLIGGTQHIRTSGFIATEFGQRIVPENRSIYPLGFNNQAFSEKNKIELHTRWVRATGFLSFGTQTSDRYGTASLWNKRQYIHHSYDSGDGLNPGEFGRWTSIANRNRIILVQGFSATRYGYNSIKNNARLLEPGSIQTVAFGKLMIADRVRRLRPDSMESPYIPSWVRIHNSAFVIAPISGKHDQWGHHSVLNTRREYRWVGAFDSMVFGLPMIDFAIRKISMQSRYSIYQPSMPLPRVDLYTRYIEQQGSELQAFGGPTLNIKWNKFTPRWTHRDYFGEPVVRNRTPELKQKGNVTEVFGHPSLRTQWRFMPVEGFGSELWGRTGISFRDRSMSIRGNNYMAIGMHRVIKTGAPPYSLQSITLDWGGEGSRPDDYEGLGIRVPENQVTPPSLKTNVIFAQGFVATKMGSHHTQSNGILLEAGIQEFTIGNHFIGLKNRKISVPTLGDLLQMRETRPRLSPHTIYAVVESPGQARNNHPYQNIHYVNSDVGSRQPGEVFGNLRVTLRHRKIYLGGFNQSSIPQPTVMLKRRYIRVTGFSTFRMGWHFALDGSPQDVEQYESRNMQAFGRPYLVSPYYGPQTIRVGGINASSFGTSRVEHFHRTIRTSGSSMMIMGASRGGDTAYKPQSLWVGRPMPTIPAGFNAEKFGNTTIGLRVRDVGVFGFDAFNAESDISNFKGRLKVIQVKQPQVIEPKEIYPQSFGHTAYGVPDIRLKVHYIRPDGNSNQFRKGGSI
jgi:hypothetical protein